MPKEQLNIWDNSTNMKGKCNYFSFPEDRKEDMIE